MNTIAFLKRQADESRRLALFHKKRHRDLMRAIRALDKTDTAKRRKKSKK